ncbi:sigma-70 family RNA polymerase sigma factor [Kitasatospora griseola]|uniref:sigma-70 family RNA polymerase sigma factor n=1 Tax=Kitasatospora griseola TaxID=2064 RepID=UPI00069788AD|nr:sigma-70 family RNA polymerase sigma factor [Kitasatospora griseola]
MDTLTLETIRQAQDKDLAAVTEVIKATESRVTSMAHKFASSSDQRDEFAQVARVAVWEAIARFDGDTVDSFFAFMTRTAEMTMRDAVRTEKNQGATGADHAALKTFAACAREANGDLDVAQALCQTLPPKGRRLSPDRARAARMAYEGPISLDMPNAETGADISDMIASDYGIPDDLVEPADITRDQRDRKIKTVRAVLDSMGAKGSYILKATYGIDPVVCLGTGAEADEELAEILDTKPATVRVLRNQAHKSFESRYSKVTGLTR